MLNATETIGDASPDGTEDLRVHLVPVSELQALIADGDMVQALHVAPLMKYLLTLR